MILTEKQTIALDYLEDQETEELLFGGAAGGGKSALGCYWQLKNRLLHEGSKGLIGRAKLKTLKETTLQTFFEIAKLQGVKIGEHFKYNAQASTIDFFNGSQIILKDLFHYPSDPNFDDLGSLEITDAFIDEVNQVAQKGVEVVRSRIRYKLPNERIKLLMSCNPSKNWVYNRYFKPSKENTLPTERKFIQSLVSDNPHIPSTYISSLKKMEDRALKERLLYGNWDYEDNDNALVTYDQILDCFTNTHVNQGKKYVSADLAMQGRDKFVVFSWSGYIANVSISKSKAEASEIEKDIAMVKRNNTTPNSQVIADADGLGAFLSSYIRNIKEFHGGTPATDKKYGTIKDECAFALARKIRESGLRIICSQEEKELIINELQVCLTALPNDLNKQKIIPKSKQKDLLGRSPDYFDALLMRFYFDVKKTYNITV